MSRQRRGAARGGGRLAAALVLAALVTWPWPARGATLDAGARRELAVTVYAADLGLVRDVREAALPAGVETLEVRDVAARLEPTSVAVRALPDHSAVVVVEQRYAFDLLSRERLLERFVGREVQLRWKEDGRVVQARLLAAGEAPLYEIDGRVHVDPPATPILPAAPGDLVTRPTLLLRVRGREARPQRLEFSYLTAGLTWEAAYTLVVDREWRRADVAGWAAVTNRSGVHYPEAAVSLVAGEVNRAAQPQPAQDMMAARAKGEAAPPRPQAFAGYHLYALDGRTSLPDRQTVQVRLVGAAGVEVTRRLVYEGGIHLWHEPGPAPALPAEFQPVTILLEVDNREARGLGRPLPGGVARVYAPDPSGALRLAGEDAIPHTPRDETARLRLGSAFDVVASRRQVDYARIDRQTIEAEWEIRLRNRSGQQETVRVIEPVPGDWRVLRASHPWQKVDASTLRVDVPVPAGGEAAVSYRVRTRW